MNESLRQRQKRLSRERNNKTTIQLNRGNKMRLEKIKLSEGFDTVDEALDEVLSFYEDEKRNECLS
ncbi:MULTISPECIES: hypothetical protein [unclassified Pseudoalteromonas]|uniref:hypothetical protein n=1 Tax=unclassified Pseudoalteromonas TaxID=194690 RepID=UPI0025B50A6B|nr:MULTISPECIES: hypothetical protein [unclassified Pseudoalteromonas]MDN3380945.1 hypothetical protein [Pseudoalteromonas sp. APC 3893]MDN3389351.1 hypothetical protein [Pseudoalteromonas sp. APC 4017]